MKYRAKPIEIEAIQFGVPGAAAEIIAWAAPKQIRLTSEGLVIPTLEGNMLATRGDFIVKGTHDEFYPVKPDIFNFKYEAVT